MSEAIWATWYDVVQDDKDTFIGWMHNVYIPFLKQTPGYTWVAHYRNVGTGPSLATYHDIAGHAASSEDLPTGNQYVLLVGATSTHTFFNPFIFDIKLPESFIAKLEMRKEVRTAILSEEARTDGPAGINESGGAEPAPAIQFGTYRIRSEQDEFDLGRWYAQQRFPVMAAMPGVIRTRKFLSSAGWAKHAILYEFESVETRTKNFEEPHESKIVDPKEWTGRIVRTTLHTPGSPFVGERIWPPI